MLVVHLCRSYVVHCVGGKTLVVSAMQILRGKGWKKAPPCWRGASLSTEGNQSTSPPLWEVMQCQELKAEELLTFPFICTFCLCASPNVIMKYGGGGWRNVNSINSEKKTLSELLRVLPDY